MLQVDRAWLHSHRLLHLTLNCRPTCRWITHNVIACVTACALSPESLQALANQCAPLQVVCGSVLIWLHCASATTCPCCWSSTFKRLLRQLGCDHAGCCFDSFRAACMCVEWGVAVDIVTNRRTALPSGGWIIPAGMGCLVHCVMARRIRGRQVGCSLYGECLLGHLWAAI